MNILLLQGPLGSFFKTLGDHFASQGHQVFHITFNAGDECWLNQGEYTHYRGTLEYWPSYLQQFCQAKQIEIVICYGDCRAYHSKAADYCRQQELAFWVFEEGYLRPDFITLELGGVNANSPLYSNRHQLANYSSAKPFQVNHTVGKTFIRRAYFASRYHITKRLFAGNYPHFVSHRPWGLIKEALSWVKGAGLKQKYRVADQRLLQQLQQAKGRIFFLPLQVSEDFQILSHSDYPDVPSVIKEVVGSFAQYADSNDILLIKHHPMDRGFVDYQPLINELREQYQLDNRLCFGYELPLPQVYPLLKGVVTVNSTVGFSALLQAVPVKCLGNALYDIPKLTTSGTLAEFWLQQSSVCKQTVKAVHTALLHHSQINGSFYRLQHETAVQAANKILQAYAPEPVIDVEDCAAVDISGVCSTI